MYALFFSLVFSCFIALIFPIVINENALEENKASINVAAVYSLRDEIMNLSCQKSALTIVSPLSNVFDFVLEKNYLHLSTNNSFGLEVVKSVLSLNTPLQVSKVNALGELTFLSKFVLTNELPTEKFKSSYVITLPILNRCAKTIDFEKEYSWGKININNCGLEDKKGSVWKNLNNHLYQDGKAISSTQFILDGVVLTSGDFYFNDGVHVLLQEKSIVINGIHYVCNTP